MLSHHEREITFGELEDVMQSTTPEELPKQIPVNLGAALYVLNAAARACTFSSQARVTLLTRAAEVHHHQNTLRKLAS